MKDIVKHGLPRADLPDQVREWRRQNLRNLWRGVRRVQLARALGLPHFEGVLYLDVINKYSGERLPYGLASMRVVTDAGVGYIVDAFQNSVELENMKFHGFGTGSTAEAASQTALVTELTTEYVSDNTRPTGSQTENGANVYRTVATPDLTPTRCASTASRPRRRVPLDFRSLYAAINPGRRDWRHAAGHLRLTITSGS